MSKTNKPPQPQPDEDADVGLVLELLFRTEGITLEPFTEEERKRGKTPDRRVFRDGKLAGYCEIKSPRSGNTNGPDPTWNRLGRQVKGGARQFAAVDPDNEVPHILVLVNHDETTRAMDLRVTFDGVEIAANGEPFATFPGAAEGVRKAAEPSIDLVIMIDARRRVVMHYVENRSRPELTRLAHELAGGPAVGTKIK